jgi:hypothetical protein
VKSEYVILLALYIYFLILNLFKIWDVVIAEHPRAVSLQDARAMVGVVQEVATG